MLITNAFSLNMLISLNCQIKIREITDNSQLKILAHGLPSAVGHADTAAIFEKELGTPVPFNRTSISLYLGDWCIVGQYVGPRLPEGSTELPEGSTIKWCMIEIIGEQE